MSYQGRPGAAPASVRRNSPQAQGVVLGMKLAPQPAGAAPSAWPHLRILFLVSAHNSLSQRVEVALTELGHRVAVEVVSSGAEMEAAVARYRPELIVCPMLKAIIPSRSGPGTAAWSSIPARGVTVAPRRWTGRSRPVPPSGA